MLQTLFGMSGRLSRTGFWEVVVSILLLDVAAAVAAITALEHAFPGGQVVTASSTYEWVRWSLLAVAVLSVWAIAAAHVKRAHDQGRGAVFLLWLLLPVLGWIWIVMELGFRPGQGFRNRFGPPPLGHHHDPHEAGERALHPQPVSHGLFGRPRYAAVPVSAQLDWTGAASEDSAEAAAHSNYDAGEALMAASEHHEPPPPPPAEALPPPAAEAHAHEEPMYGHGAPPGPPPDHSAQPHDELSAAMGTPRTAH